jgi:BirA family biotin operon repressor/biotin-[acetyl-CoA-carboxylase] ligase
VPLAAGVLPSLTFSLGLPLKPDDWSGLSLAVGLSVVESLHPALQLKWPNDVWLQERKLAGILIETASVGDVRYAVIGVGINIAPRDGEGLSTPPAALSELLPDLDAPAALECVVPALVRAIQRFEAQGFAPLRAAFHARDVFYGKTVQCSDGLTGVARGVDATGALLVHTENGLKKITSAEVSVRPAP